MVLENLFTFNGVPGHEWVAVHEARLLDERLLTLVPPELGDLLRRGW